MPEMSSSRGLEVQGLSVGYRGVDVVHSVDITVAAGSVVALMGSNGAGKSTILKTIMGALTPSSGSISLGGSRIDGKSTTEVAALGVALVPEGRRVFGGQSIGANLLTGAWPGRRKGIRRLKELRDDMYERFPILHERRRQDAGSLSGGEAQMLSIAMALMAEPAVLLLDEPSLGLAPIIADAVFDEIVKLRDEGKTVLVVEQNAGKALTVADEAYVLRLGQITASGPASDVAARDELQNAYLGG